MMSDFLERTIRSAREKGLLSFMTPLRRIIPRVLFETKCARWDARNLDTLDAKIETDIPVTADLTAFDETLRWIESLGIEELLDERDLRIAVREGHYWGNLKHQGRNQ